MRDLLCVQLASHLEGGPLMWMMPLHVNKQKSDYDMIIEPRHEISNNVVCATSKGSDQPAHMRILIKAFASSLNIL